MSQMSFPGMDSGGNSSGVSVTEVAAAISVDTSLADQQVKQLGDHIVQEGEKSANAPGWTKWGDNVAAAGQKALYSLRSLSMAFGSTSPFGPIVQSIAAVQAGLSMLDTKIEKTASKFEMLRVAGTNLMAVGGVILGIGAALTSIGAPLQNANAALTTAIANTTDKLTGASNSIADFQSQINQLGAASARFGFNTADVNNALAKLTVQTKDPTEAMKELTFAETLAVAGHQNLAAATDQLGRMHAGLFRSLRMYGIQLPNVTNSQKEAEKATKDLAAATQKLNDANQAMSDFEAKVHEAMAKRTEQWAQRVEAAQQRAMDSQTAYQDAQTKQAQTAADLQQKVQDAQETAAQRVADALQHLDDLKQQYADQDAQRLQQQQENIENARQTEEDAAMKLADLQERIALRPARTGVEQFNNMVALRDAQLNVNKAKEKEADAANKALVTQTEQAARARALEQAQDNIVKAQQTQAKAQEVAAKAQEQNARALEQVAKAFERMTTAQDKLKEAQAGAATAGQMTPAEKAQEDRLNRSIAREQKAIAKAQAMQEDAKNNEAQRQAAFQKAEDQFMQREAGLLDRRSKTWAGHVAGIKAHIEDLFMSLGKFAPTLTAVGGASMGVGAIVNLIGHLGEVGKKIFGIGKVAGEAEKVAGTAGSMGKLAKAAEFMKGGISTAISGIGPIFEGLGAVLLGPIGGIVLAIAGIAAIGYVIYRNWDTIKEALAKVWNAIYGAAKDVFNSVFNFLKQWWDKLLLIPPFTLVGIAVQIFKHWGEISKVITGVFDDVVKFLKNWWPELLLIPPFTLVGVGAIIFQHWGEISKTITGIFDDLVKWFTSLPDKIWKALGDLWGKFKDAGMNIINGIWRGVSDTVVNFFNFVTGIPGKIWDALGDLWSKFKDAGKNIVNGLWRGISEIWDDFVKWVENAFKHSFVGKILSFLNITSPSGVFKDIGKNIVLGLQSGIAGNTSLVEDAANKLAKATQFKPVAPGGFSAAGGSSVPGGGPYAGTSTTAAGGNPVYINWVVNLNVAGNVVTADELKADFRSYLQRGAQQNGGLLRFLQVQP